MEIYENPPNQYLCKINKKTKRKNRITWEIVQSQEERHKSKSSASNVDFKHISVYLEYFLLCLVCKLPLQLMLCLKKFEKTYPYFLARLIIRTQSKEIYKNIILIFVTSRICSEQLLLSLNCGNDNHFRQITVRACHCQSSTHCVLEPAWTLRKQRSLKIRVLEI